MSTTQSRNSKLDRLFDEFNRQFWQGRLRPYRVVYARLPGTIDGRTYNGKRLIKLDPAGCKPTQSLRETLLHEMCHIGCPGHGKKFLSKLMTLAEQGESWALSQATLLPNQPTRNQRTADVKDFLKQWATRKPRPKFPAVVSKCAQEFNCTSREVTRQFPWLVQAWKNACKEADGNKLERRRWLDAQNVSYKDRVQRRLTGNS